MRQPSNLKVGLGFALACVLAVPFGCNPIVIQGVGSGGSLDVSSVIVTSASTGASSGFGANGCWSTVAAGWTTSSGWSTATCGSCQSNPSASSNCLNCAFNCASNAPCRQESLVFGQVGGANPWLKCARACPVDDPSTASNEFRTCLFACNAAYPGVEAAYQPVLECIACHFCSNQCNADLRYGDCSVLMAPPPGE